MSKIERFYRKQSEREELCFNIETSAPLTEEELERLKWLLAEGYAFDNLRKRSFLSSKKGSYPVEVGPRLNFETPASSNAVSICRAIGLEKITRLEVSRRTLLVPHMGKDMFLKIGHDQMTECEYPSPLKTFETGIKPEPVRTIPLMKNGLVELEKENLRMGLGLDEADRKFVFNLFVHEFKRNPTDVELFGWSNAFSEHSRHGFFKGKQRIDGKDMPHTLFDIVKSTWYANLSNSVLAFCDNSSVLQGYDVWTIIPKRPGQTSSFTARQFRYHILFTAETHNFPSGVAPRPGAETGTGGRIRDVQATGRGALVVAGTAGYCVAALNIPGYNIPGEPKENWEHPSNLASPLDILIEESNGASDYGNKFGEPVINGFCRTFDMRLPDGERRAWLKPIMFTGGIGQVEHEHLEKKRPEAGMLIVQIGGPAYRVGMGGGSASSMVQGENEADLDFNAVQRGNAEMENKYNRVIRACVEMGFGNPIESIHDQGAGGPCNVLTEIVEKAGGRVELRNINVGDKTMSVMEIWGAEYQERVALLIWPERIEEFQAICEREKVNCEVLGEITGDGRFVVHDSQDGSTPFDMDIAKSMDGVPQKIFSSEHIERKRLPLELPKDPDIGKLIQDVFKLPSVGSKGFLVRKVDRSVTGLIVQQQCCGAFQLPVCDYGAIAQSHFGMTGAVTAVGEQPVKMLVDVKAGARMAVAEALTNIMFARVPSIKHIKCSLNWMWAAKLAGEGALIYDAALAMKEIMIELGIAVDGGKDSLSMAAKTRTEMVKAPGQMAVSFYAPMKDIAKKVTPDIKHPAESSLWIIDLAVGKRRLGGSALAQSLGQIGNETPDVENVELLKRVFEGVQLAISSGLITAGHDISDGGLITTVAEMIMPSMCGAILELDKYFSPIEHLFSEELGMVIEIPDEKVNEATKIFYDRDIPCYSLGMTSSHPELTIIKEEDSSMIFKARTKDLLEWWERTSDELENYQMNDEVAEEQAKNHVRRYYPTYGLTLEPRQPIPIPPLTDRPKVAIIREEGSNGDREMASAFYMAGFDTQNVKMDDLLRGKTNLNYFRGIAFVGGFSYADVLGSAKGWAATIKFNEKLRIMFDEFYARPDTFSLGVCNGCQLMALLGLVPFGKEGDCFFVKNSSERFESRWSRVVIISSPAIMLKDMEGSILGIHVAHGEGRLLVNDKDVYRKIISKKLAPIAFVNGDGVPTESYPENPNGSPSGITALCSPDGRHLAMMPHPERTFLKWQWHYWPKEWKEVEVSPWLKMFQNAYEWCMKNK